MKYLLRIVGLPAITFIALLAGLHHACILIWNFIRYGGEFIAYTKRGQSKGIADVYQKVEDHFDVSRHFNNV